MERLTEGSSPLARGLLHLEIGRIIVHRIIPARAGFTLHHHGIYSASRDHPRSRGVYSPRRPSGRSFCGSSPLARGLRRQTRLGPDPRRIIPARAGFTPRCRDGRCRRSDHPRSRGVYAGILNACVSALGSSPLARGLLPPPVHTHGGRGIIPARAGFTSYNTKPEYGAPGSSPLARGLLDVGAVVAPVLGIIPARAGFTARTGGGRRAGGDHPRSRGVYCPRPTSRRGTSGSSPLARGLPVARVSRGLAQRIIPARAGFTSPPSHGPPTTTDHPRSRGVYRGFATASRMASGSSPLARGLLDARHAPPVAARIIPARAGFTELGNPRRRRMEDHPRSRGVYLKQLGGQRSGAGSSPLARGLRHRLRRCRS